MNRLKIATLYLVVASSAMVASYTLGSRRRRGQRPADRTRTIQREKTVRLATTDEITQLLSRVQRVFRGSLDKQKIASGLSLVENLTERVNHEHRSNPRGDLIFIAKIMTVLTSERTPDKSKSIAMRYMENYEIKSSGQIKTNVIATLNAIKASMQPRQPPSRKQSRNRNKRKRL